MIGFVVRMKTMKNDWFCCLNENYRMTRHMLPPKRVACFCKPSGITTSEGKQLTHILAALGAVGIPHLQQGTLPMV